MAKAKKLTRRNTIKMRTRKKIKGTALRPRLSVFRSNKQIYAQLIDDLNGHTLCTASSKEGVCSSAGNKIEQAKAVGKLIAERAKGDNIDNAVFDRSGYLYHGRVKAVAEGAREGGLTI